MIANPTKLGAEICEVLGLDYRLVTSLTIRIRIGEVPTVEVERFIDGDTELHEVTE
jgi:hypothetical protein